jgi:hypothetical protein
MTRQSRRWSTRFTLSLVIGLVFACGIRADELNCEEAVAYLQSCCPGLQTSNIDCTYVAPQGCGSAVLPEISGSESQCIRAESCGGLQASGVCDRVRALPPRADWHDASLSDGGAFHPAVCP